MTLRTETKTEKIKTDFGSMFLHVDHIGGTVEGVSLSAPQKLEDTQIERLLIQVLQTVTSIIRREINVA